MVSLFCRIGAIAWLCLVPIGAKAVTPMIAADQVSALLLNSDGSVWGTGIGGATSPVRMFELPNIVAVAAGNGGYYPFAWGGSAYFALTADGSLWAMGRNGYGQLGDGTTQDRAQPQLVTGLADVKAVVASDHVLALKGDGTVWAWGNNRNGQLGDGTTTDRHAPTQVAGIGNVIQVALSASSSLALRQDGTVWMWGDARFGAAGNGTMLGDYDSDRNHVVPSQVTIDNVIAIAGGAGGSLALRSDGTVWAWGDFLTHGSVPTLIAGLDHVAEIDAKAEGTFFARKSDGTVWAWGENNKGQLGIVGSAVVGSPTQVPGVSDALAIAAGREFAIALRADGVVLAWGDNSYGQLGDGGLQGHVDPLPVQSPGGAGQINLLQPAPTIYNQLPAAQISVNLNAGKAPLTVQANVSSASDPDGSIVGYAWTTSDGQQAAGSSASFTFQQPGTYKINLLVEDNAGGRRFAAQQVMVSPRDASVAATPRFLIGEFGGIALANDGHVLTWGEFGRLGVYDPQLHPRSMNLPFFNGISGAVDVTLESGGGHALLSDGSVLGWGGNSWGTPGVGDTTTSLILQPRLLPNLPAVQSLASGSQHGLALTPDGRVFAWGGNSFGQLGLADNSDRYAPVEVVSLGGGVIAVAASAWYSAALKSDGTVWTWGASEFSSARNVPVQIPELNGIAKLFASPSALFARAADGAVWVSGNLPFAIAGDAGGTRHVPALDGAVRIAGGSQHLVVLKADGTVWTGGKRLSFALGFDAGGDTAGLVQLKGISDAVDVAASEINSAALRSDGTVLSWGRNAYGQIADGTLATRLTPVLVLNETGDGFLDLVPDVNFEVPPSVGVPFFVVAAGDVSSTNASVSTTTKFNAGDLGKNGEVYVTATVPAGSLVPVTSPMGAAGTSGSSAATATSSFVLVNLTSSGQWQPVSNGQVLPYATGVLGDQLSAQTILDNTDTTNLKGAQFCLGYGLSAAQMIASGTMRVVASIPDPNATGAVAPTCILAGPPVSYSLNLPQGWSLLGNSLNQALTVATLFNDPNAITSVWKWDANTFGWQFYTPQMTASELHAYAASKGYAVLATINPGEGYWVNAKSQPTIAAQSGDSFILTGMNLMKGWNLVATGNDIAPTEFNAGLKASAVPASLKTLWAWDNPSSKWYFYAPSLEEQGGTALSGYIANKGYLDFTTTNKKLGSGTGFWVNR